MIGRKAPSTYLSAIQSHKQVGLDDDGMNAILKSHRIDSAAMRADDFEQFYEKRKDSLLEVVESAMGKAIETEGAEDDEP